MIQIPRFISDVKLLLMVFHSLQETSAYVQQLEIEYYNLPRFLARVCPVEHAIAIWCFKKYPPCGTYLSFSAVPWGYHTHE